MNDADLRATAHVMPPTKITIRAAVWGDADDHDNWATIMDGADHPGRAWVMFAGASDEVRSTRFRADVLHEIAVHRPGALSLPAIDHRTVPLARDLVRTAAGYQLNPTAAARYGR